MGRRVQAREQEGREQTAINKADGVSEQQQRVAAALAQSQVRTARGVRGAHWRSVRRGADGHARLNSSTPVLLCSEADRQLALNAFPTRFAGIAAPPPFDAERGEGQWTIRHRHRCAPCTSLRQPASPRRCLSCRCSAAGRWGSDLCKPETDCRGRPQQQATTAQGTSTRGR